MSPVDAHRLLGEPLLALARSVNDLRARCAAEAGGEAPRPAEPTDDAELVHDLRVAMRRLRSVLKPVRGLYGGRVCDEAELAMRTWLDGTSDLRDEEVLRETLDKLALEDPAEDAALRAWMVGRARRERGARGRTLTAVSTGDAAPIEALEKRLLKGPKHEDDAAAFASSMIDRALAKLEGRAEAADPADVEAMHRTRIAAKKLRYAAALLAATWDEREALAKKERREGEEKAETPALVAALHALEKGASKIQKRLGDLHDLDEAMVRMRRAWGLDLHVREAILRALAQKRAHVAARVGRDLLPEVRALRDLFAGLDDWTPPAALLTPAIGAGDAPSDALEEGGDALADADAEARDAAPRAGGLHGVEERDGDASP